MPSHTSHQNARSAKLLSTLPALLLCALFGLGACTTPSLPTVDLGSAVGQASAEIACEPLAGITPSCGFRNPEDLAVLPGGDWLMVSEMGPFLQNTPNTLSLFNIAANQRVAFDVAWETDQPRWGNKTCTAPDPAAFSPHGIDFLTLPNGKHQLLVVNHGSESIEFFAVSYTHMTLPTNREV